MNLKSLFRISFVLMAIIFGQHAYAEAVWIDVRSSVEHAIDSIEGDVHIAHEDIVKEGSKLYPDKSTEIHLYCQSGGRAGKAKSSLEEVGYTNVTNYGGISDARKERHLSE